MHTKIAEEMKSITTIILIVVLISSLFSPAVSLGATYTFTQNSWTIEDAGNATHPTDQNDWATYSAKDANISAGTNISLSTTSYTATDDGTLTTTGSATGGGFGNGTHSTTIASGSEAEGNVKLTTTSSMGSGADGAITISTAKNINTDTIATGRTCADGGDGIAYSVTALASNTATLSSTPSAGCLAANNLVLLINLQADGTNLTNVGNYEILTIQSVSTDTITFTTNKTKYYGNGAGNDTNIGTATTNQRVILQRIPQYTDVTIASGGSLVANTWDGTKGGVLIFYANGTVDVQSGGSITMTGKGYRPYSLGDSYGAGESYNSYGPGTYDSSNLGGGGLEFDGVEGDILSGGGYGTQGQGGTTAKGLTYGDINLADLFMGSAAASSSPVVRGGLGGGIIYISAGTVLITGSLLNKGGEGHAFAASGAGGSVYIKGNTLTLGTNKIDAKGGTTGGDGGDGRIYLQSSSITGTTTPTATTAALAAVYNTPGTFTSAVIDTTGAASWGNLSWTSSGTGTIVMKARSSVNADMSGATDWASCTNITSGQALSTGGCVTNSHRYIQYQAGLSTADTAVSPSLDSVTVGYNVYSASQTLTSSAYDSLDATNAMGQLGWDEDATLPSGTTVTFSLRTASASGGIDAASWTDLTSISSGCSKASATVTCLATALPAGMKDGTGDRWFQYKISLTGGTYTPTVDNVEIKYVVNAAPAFEAAPTVSQGTDGKVNISYSIKDIDTDTPGNVTRNFVTPSFEYSINGGSNYYAVASANITRGDAPVGGEITDTNSDGSLDNKVLGGSYLTYTIAWDAKTQLNTQTYVANARIRVTIDDNEGANRTATSESANYELDIKDPVLGVTPMIVDAASSPAVVTLSVTDDTAKEMQVDGNNATLTGVSYETYGAKSLTLTGNPSTVYARVKDARGNTTSIFSLATITTPTNVYVQDLTNLVLAPGAYRLMVNWDVISTPADGFKYYKIYRSVDSGAYSLLATTAQGDVSVNYYIDSTVLSGSNYTYKVASQDNSNNISFLSTATGVGIPDGVQNSGEGGGRTDFTVPAISNISVDKSQPHIVTISWNTNEAGTSIVNYGTTNSYGLSAGTSSAYATSHSVSLPNLVADTVYHYQISSTDAANNNITSVDATFTSQPALQVSVGSDTSATITWTTIAESNSVVEYGTTVAYGMNASNTSLVTSHSVTLTGLTGSTTYYFRVKSTDVESQTITDDNNGLSYSFLTFPTPVGGRSASVDTTAPAISDISVSNITGTSFQVSWKTSESASSVVYYGKTTSYGYLAGVPDLFTADHIVSVVNLSPVTEYNFQIVSLDKSTNKATSENRTVVTTGSASTTSTSETENQIGTLSEQVNTLQGQKNSLQMQIISLQSQISILAPDDPSIVNLQAELDALQVQYTEISTNLSQAEASLATLQGSTGSSGVATDLSGEVSSLQEQQQFSEQLIASLEQQLATGLTGEAADSIRSQIKKLKEELGFTRDKLRQTEQALLEVNALKAQVASLQESLDYMTDKILGIKKGDTLSPADLLKTVSLKFQGLAQLFKSSATVQEKQNLENVLGDTATTLKDLTNLVPGPKIITTPNIEVHSTNATVGWTTDKEATGLVAYSDEASFKDKKYLNQAGDLSKNGTSHSVDLVGLTPSTVYHYKIISKSDSGAETNSLDFNFTTKTEVPAISKVAVSKLSDSSLQISWQTNIPANSIVTYVPTISGTPDTANSKSQGVPEYTKDHTVKIEGLKGGMTYNVNISSTDAFNNIITQKLDNLTTILDKVAPIITELRPRIAIIPEGNEVTIQTIITWKTDEPATTQVVYDKGSGTEGKFVSSTDVNDELTYNHAIVITNWDSNSFYSFKAISKDQTGNEASSKVYTVHTPEQKGTIIDVITNNFTDVFGWTKNLGN